MKTILYNTNTQELTYHAKEGYYLVDGVRPTLPSDMVELTEVEEITPSYNVETQRLTNSWVVDLTTLEYRKEFTVVDLTAKELAAKEWKHIDYTKKLTIDEDVAKTSVGVFHFMRFEKNGNPLEYDNVNKKWYVWMQGIDPSYQEDYNALVQSGELTIANRPAILD